MRRLVTLVSALLVAGIPVGAGIPALADHTPINATPDYNLVDGTPICGVEGAQFDPAPELSGTLPTVGTYNILHSQDEDDRADVSARQDLIVDALVEGDADIWGLQEVTDDAEHGSQAQELAAALALETGEPWSWCWSWSNPHFPAEPDVLPGGGGPLSLLTAQFSKLPEGDVTGFKEGVAVLTRLEIDVDSARFRRLQPRVHEALACPLTADPLDLIGCQFPAAFDARQLLHVPVVAGSQTFDVFNTHIAHGLTDHSNDTKAAHIEKALATIDEWADRSTPDYFTGDFNSTPDTEGRIGQITAAGFTDTYAASGAPECGSQVDTTVGCTSSVRQFLPTGETQDRLRGRIDYVFARHPLVECELTVPGSVIIGTNTKPGDGGDIWPSDHLGVASETACP